LVVGGRIEDLVLELDFFSITGSPPISFPASWKVYSYHHFPKYLLILPSPHSSPHLFASYFIPYPLHSCYNQYPTSIPRGITIPLRLHQYNNIFYRLFTDCHPYFSPPNATTSSIFVSLACRSYPTTNNTSLRSRLARNSVRSVLCFC